MQNLEQQQIETIVLDWANAVSAGDRDGILAGHAPDLLMFDFPDTVRGIEAYGRTGRGFRHLRGSLRWHVGWITRFPIDRRA